MRVIARVLVFSLAATAALAAKVEFWRVTSPEDFLSGELEGMAVTSRGELQPGPAIKKLASFTEPFVLSQTADRSGNRFLGTGNQGKVYRVEGTNVRELFVASEPEIYAVTFSGDSLYVGSSPNGKVYRVNPKSGESSVFFDPKEAYIWAIEPLGDGSLAVATGVEGKLFRVDAKGEGKVWFDAPEAHIRSLTATRGGKLLLGGSGEGRIYEVEGEGRGRALYDSDFPEISAIYYDSSRNVAWAAAVTNVLPTTPPKPPEPAKPAQASAESKQEQSQSSAAGAAVVDISFSFDQSATTQASGGGSSELYRIDADGYVETVRKFDREMVYSIAGEGEALLLSTGPLGRLYRFHDNEIALIATLPEKQIVSVARDGSAFVATTTNAGAVYRVEPGRGGKSEYRSAVKDTGRFSSFGQYLIEGKSLSGARIQSAFRSGNTATPDETWSDWSSSSGPEGRINAPSARYVQWRLTLENAPAALLIDSMAGAYVNRNVAPVIEGVVVHEPGAVFLSGAFPQGGQVVEATNPDEHGMFSSLDNPRQPGDPGKKLYRKGYRTISWKASDANGDKLRYSLYFRPQGSSEWMKMREEMEESRFNFDTSQLPDGTYEVRVTATDAPDNPEAPLHDAKEGVDFRVDNTAPAITARRNGRDLEIEIRDSASPIARVEYSVDAGEWKRLLPEDRIADSSQESFKLSAAETDGKFVVVRAMDAYYNVATQSVR